MAQFPFAGKREYKRTSPRQIQTYMLKSSAMLIAAEVCVRGVDVRHRVERLHDGVDAPPAPREPARDELPPQSLVAPRHDAGVVEVVGRERLVLQGVFE